MQGPEKRPRVEEGKNEVVKRRIIKPGLPKIVAAQPAFSLLHDQCICRLAILIGATDKGRLQCKWGRQYLRSYTLLDDAFLMDAIDYRYCHVLRAPLIKFQEQAIQEDWKWLEELRKSRGEG